MGTSDVTGDQIASYHQDGYGNVLSSMNTGAWAASFGSPHLMTTQYDRDAEMYTLLEDHLDPQTGRHTSLSSVPFAANSPSNVIDIQGGSESVPDHAGCPPGKEPIWYCKSRLPIKTVSPGWGVIINPPKIGPIFHASICCDGPNDRCYTHWPTDRGGGIIRDPMEGALMCIKRCQDPQKKSACCDNPEKDLPYSFFRQNCQKWVDGCLQGSSLAPGEWWKLPFVAIWPL